MFKYKSPCAIVLFIIMLQPEAKTQKVAYADVQLGHEIKIAGKTGNNIHVWSSSISQPLSFIKKATLTLHVLSADMRLQTEKKIELGEVISWDIDFQFEDSCYYANIIFFAAFNDKLLLKIDPDGNITDLTEKPALWRRPRLVNTSTSAYTIVQKDNTAFAAKIENFRTSLTKDIIKLIAGEQFNDQEDYNRVVVKKVNLNNQLASQSVYASSKVNFYYPLLAVSDTAVLICAFTEAESNAVRGKNSNPYMFFVKLDTNLAERNSGPVLLKSNKRFKDETFLPRSISAFGNGYCIISVGQYQDPYAYERTNSSLRFTMIDNKNNLVKDTVIADKRGRERFQWNNFFTIPSDNGIDFFCARQDDLYKSGIIHLSIDSSGNIKEQNMVVNGHYDYLLPESKKLSPGVLLIPFIHNGNTALMKLDYR